MSKNYPPLKRNPANTEEQANKFAAAFNVWPPRESDSGNVGTLLNLCLTLEAQEAFKIDNTNFLRDEINEATSLPYALSNANDHYFNVSNYFFHMIEHPENFTSSDMIMVMGQDGEFYLILQ
jgi:hypothetical protein